MIDSTRRALLRTGSALPAAWTAALAGAVLLPAAMPATAATKPRLWRAADILIGQSPADQAPALANTCPLYFANGNDANASHTLDLGAFPVRGDITWDGETIEPDWSASLAFAVTQGSDGHYYMLGGLEGTVSGGSGRFAGVTRAIVRCKYKVLPASPMPLLVSCVYCAIVLVSD